MENAETTHATSDKGESLFPIGARNWQPWLANLAPPYATVNVPMIPVTTSGLTPPQAFFVAGNGYALPLMKYVPVAAHSVQAINKPHTQRFESSELEEGQTVQQSVSAYTIDLTSDASEASEQATPDMATPVVPPAVLNPHVSSPVKHSKPCTSSSGGCASPFPFSLDANMSTSSESNSLSQTPSTSFTDTSGSFDSPEYHSPAIHSAILCPVANCKKVFGDNRTFCRHMHWTHHNPKSRFNGMQAKYRNFLQKGTKKKGNRTEQIVKLGFDDQKIATICSDCDNTLFNTILDFAMHLDLYHEEPYRIYKCETKGCPWSVLGFSRRQALAHHVTRRHTSTQAILDF